MNVSLRMLSFLLLFCALCVPAGAQPWRTERTLLWEISGNGLAKPSYLYGTFHRRDSSVFRLADSVLIVLRSCDAFAGELDLDAAMREFMVRYLVSDDGPARLIRAARGDTTPPLRRDTLQAAASDSVAEDSSDAGVRERVLDSAGIANANSAADTSVAASAIDTLPQEDSIAQAVPEDEEESDEDDEDYSLPPSRRWNLLAERGTDILSSTERTREGDRPTILDGYLYGVARSLGKRIIGLETINEQIAAFEDRMGSPDILHGIRSARRFRTARNLAEEIVAGYSRRDLGALYDALRESTTPGSFRRIITDRNYTMADRAERYMREGSVFIAVGAGHLPGRQGMLDLLTARGYTVRPVAATFNNYNADSIGIPPSRTEWHTTVSAEGAFRVEMPAEPVAFPVDMEATEHYNEAHRVVWPDVGTGIMYSAGYLDGSMPAEEGPALAAVERALTDEYATMEIYRTDLDLEGMPGLETIRVMTEEGEADGGRAIRRHLYRRGMRVYVMEVIGIRRQVQSADAERFFASFRPMPFPSIVWQEWSPGGSGFGAEFFGAPRMHSDMLPASFTDAHTMYQAYNPAAGEVAGVHVLELSPFYEARDSLHLYRDVAQFLALDNDTSRALRAIVQDGVPGVEVNIGAGRKWHDTRLRLFLRGGRVIAQRFTAYGHVLDERAAGRFFGSLCLDSSVVPGDPFADKGERILDSVAATEHLEWGALRRAYDTYPFTTKHLARVREMLEHTYADEDELFPVRARLVKVLGRIGDSSDVLFLRRLYPSVVAHNSIRESIQQALVDIGSNDARALLDTIIHEDIAAGRDLGAIVRYATYRIQAARPLVPRMLELFERDVCPLETYVFIVTALDSGVMDPTTLAPYLGTIVKKGGDLLRRPATRRPARRNSDTDEDDDTDWPRLWRQRYTAVMLGYLPDSPRGKALLERMLVEPDQELRFNALRSLVRKGHRVPRKFVDSVAADPYYRVEVYELFRSTDMVALIPERYRTQRSIAEGALVHKVIEEGRGERDERETVPADVVYIADREINEEGVAGRLYVLAFHFGDEEWRVGISGLQPLDPNAVNPHADMVYTMYEAREERTIDEHVEVLLREWRKEKKDMMNDE